MPSDNICIKAPNLQPDHLAVVKYLSPAPDIILLNEKSQAGAGHPSVYRNSSPQPFPFASCANCIKAPLFWMGCQSWKPLSSPLGYTRNFTCSLLPKITHKLKPRVISWKANPAKGMPCLAINEGNQQQDDNMSRDRAFLCSQELHMHLAPCQCFRSLFSLILRDSGWDIYCWLSYLVVNHKTEAGGAKARGKEGEWTMKLSSSPGAAVSPLATPHSLPSCFLWLCPFLSTSESSTYCLVGLGHGQDYGKHTDQLENGSKEEPVAQHILQERGLRDFRWGEIQLCSHSQCTFLLYCSQKDWLLQEGEYRAIFCIILSGIHFVLPKNDRLPRYSWSTGAITKRIRKAVFNLGVCLLSTCLQKQLSSLGIRPFVSEEQTKKKWTMLMKQ